MKVLLLSAYHAASHAQWCSGLVAAFPTYQWTVLTLPGRYFSWRIRGNSLSWAWQQRQTLEQDYDLLVATSMVDLSALRGFVPRLGQIPTLVYFHENQFAYPLSGQAFTSVEPQILNLYSALCADQLLFNSHYNLQSFLNGAKQLLARLPDQVPAGIAEHLASRSQVLSVPLDNDWFSDVAEGCPPQSQASTSGGCSGADNLEADDRPGGAGTRAQAGAEDAALTIVWCGRHEYDKGPDRLLAILVELEASKLDYQLVVLGQQFKNSPPEFNRIRQLFAHRLLHFGYVASRTSYRQWLQAADIVLSTALHEFQGLAAMEAVACGCTPVLPNRLAYPEWVSAPCLYRSCENTASAAEIASEARSAVALIVNASSLPVPNLASYSWNAMQPRYAEILSQTATRKRG